MQVVKVDNEVEGHPLTLCEQPEPECARDGVLIKSVASGVNRADLLQRDGNYPPPPGASGNLGLEVSGVITKVGADIHDWKEGDAVCALLAGGGYASIVAAHAKHLIRVPENISLQAAAGIPEVFLTAFTNLFQECSVRAGERVLVHGGSSGVGTAAIQLLREAGCRIACTVGSESKADFCRKLGAEVVVNYKEQNFVEEVQRLWGAHGGVDAILDSIGGEYLERNIELLSSKGRLIIIATQCGSKGTLNIVHLMRKRARVLGNVLRSQSDQEKAEILSSFMARFGTKLYDGSIAPVVDTFFSVHDAEAAHSRMRESAHIGKIILTW